MTIRFNLQLKEGIKKIEFPTALSDTNTKMSSIPKLSSLENLEIQNNFSESLAADPITANYSRQVDNACYSRVAPKSFPKAQLLAYSQELAEEIGLDPAQCERPEFVSIFSGTKLLPGMKPYANCYGGHQFGHWAGQLGDGRAINLGEVISPGQQHWQLQLKGAGPTPYSRTADGLAVLRSSVREFLCSEAMHHLGVPTTRALSLLTSGEHIERDMFYDGHPKMEPGAIVCRVAPSFTRFGSFEIFAARNNLALLKQLTDYSIRKDFPQLLSSVSGHIGPGEYCAFFREICQLTVTMIVHWMRVGFVHGVMNTDNLSILGLTIDYGPYGWLEDYDPHWTPNTTDAQGKRYRFGQQPQIALWNLLQLGNALSPLINASEPITEALEEYKSSYEQQWQQMMANKLGLNTIDKNNDNTLINDLLTALQSTETDMTIFFRELSNAKAQDNAAVITDNELLAPIQSAFYLNHEQTGSQDRTLLCQWMHTYQQRLLLENCSDKQRRQQMNATNPEYVLRNYLAQLAIDKAEQGDNGLLTELMQVLKTPYNKQKGKDHIAKKRPEWARHRAGCSMLSCSS